MKMEGTTGMTQSQLRSLKTFIEAGVISLLMPVHTFLTKKAARPRAKALTIMSMFVIISSMLMLQGTPQAFARTLPPSLSTAPAATTPDVKVPATTTSYYEHTTDHSTLHSQGCKAASKSGIVVLDFGEAAHSGSTYGTHLFSSGRYVSNDTILGAVKSFIDGVWHCRTGSKSVVVAIGTNNDNSALGGNGSDSRWYTAGQRWGDLANNALKYIDQHLNRSGVAVNGADDIETQWSSYDRSSSFVKGYNNTSSIRFLDYGNDLGQWTKDHIWYIAYGAHDDLPLPEIYDTSWATTYWEPLDVWACNHKGGAIGFLGTMSTAGFASPSASFKALYNALGTNHCTKQKRSVMQNETFIKFA